MRALILLLLVFLFLACQENKPVSSKELLQYSLIRTNGLYKKIKRDDAVIEVLYKPSDLILAQKIDGKHYTLLEIDSLKQEFDRYCYFMIKLSLDGKAVETSIDSQRLQEATNYLSYYVGKDFKLIQGQDTIHVADFMHMRTFVTTSTTNILIAFRYQVKESPEKLSVLFDDKFFHTGQTRFDFQADDMLAVPPLNIFRTIREQ